MAEKINHPSHYNALDVECIDVIQHFDFCIGSAMKYLWRAGLKEGAADVDDYKKAIWYIQRKIELLENSQTKKGDQVPEPAEFILADGTKARWLKVEPPARPADLQGKDAIREYMLNDGTKAYFKVVADLAEADLDAHDTTTSW